MPALKPNRSPNQGALRSRTQWAAALAVIVATVFSFPVRAQEEPKPPSTLDTPPRDLEKPSETGPKVPLQGEEKSGVIRPPEIDPTMSKPVPNVDPAMRKTPKPESTHPGALKDQGKTPDIQPR